MNHETFVKVMKERIAKCEKVMLAKNKEYASDADKLQNFKDGAAISGDTPAQVCMDYMLKHFVSVKDIVNRGCKVKPKLWDEKIGDLINYALLLDAIVQEGRAK